MPLSATGISPEDTVAQQVTKWNTFLAANQLIIQYPNPAPTLTPLHPDSIAAIREAMSAIDGNIVITGTEIASAGFELHRDFGTAASAKNDAALAEAQAKIADLEAAVLALGGTD
jgi:hypothetical protein